MITILEPGIDYHWKSKKCLVHKKTKEAVLGDIISKTCKRCGFYYPARANQVKLMGVLTRAGISDTGFVDIEL